MEKVVLVFRDSFKHIITQVEVTVKPTWDRSKDNYKRIVKDHISYVLENILENECGVSYIEIERKHLEEF